MAEDKLAALYGERYFFGEEYADYVRDRPAAERSFSRRLRKLLKFVSDPENKDLLEIGSAYGFFLNVAKPFFRSVRGVDISHSAVEFARTSFQLSVECGDLPSLQDNRNIDVACMWDTIEHLRRPDLHLKWLAEHMRPGSVLAITTGDIESPVARWRGAKWRQIHPPTHLHYFSVNTLTRLLKQYGFACRLAAYDGMHRSLEMMSYIVFCRRHNTPAIHEALKRLGILNVDVYLNLRDIVFVIAEKIV